MHRNEVVDLQEFRNADTGGTNQNDEGTQNLPSGTTLLVGQYIIDGYLNCGGFGITYTARDSLGRKVVIKECFPAEMVYRRSRAMAPRSPKYRDELAAVVRSFVTEAMSLANVKHDNIIHVHQIFEENETAYMAMDFIDGPDLLDIVESGRKLPPKQIEALTRKMLEAIRYVHAQGMLHRDISPDNILIDKAGEPVLIDFGAARQFAQQHPHGGCKMKFVKDGYSPQEFYIAGSAQGTFSDLYSFAASIHHVITGAAPIDAQTRMAALAARKPDPYTPLVGQVTGFSTRFLKAIDKALSVAPEDRIQTAEEWLNRIPARSSDAASLVFAPATAVLESLSVFDDKQRVKSLETATRNKTVLAAGLAGLALLIGAGVFLARGGGDALEAPQLTEAAPLPVEASPPELTRLAAIEPPRPLVSVWPDGFSSGLSDSLAISPVTLAAADKAGPLALGDVLPPAAPRIAVPEIARPGMEFRAPGIAGLGQSAPATIELAAEGSQTLTRFDRSMPLPEIATPRPPRKPTVILTDSVAGNQMSPAPLDISIASIAPVALSENVTALPSPPLATRVTVDTLAPAFMPRSAGQGTDSAYSRWELDMPFQSRPGRAGDAETQVVIDVLPEADLALSGEWISEGVIIVAFNDAPLTEGMTLSEHMLAALEIDPDGYARATVWYRVPPEELLDQAVLAVPVVRKTALADGTVLETRKEGVSWVTSVASIGSATTDLEVGDLIVGNSTSNTRFADHEAVETALNAFAQSGVTAAEFSVLRNGQRVSASWQMASR